MKKKLIATLLATAMLAACLAGCGEKKQESQESTPKVETGSSESETASSQEEEEKPVYLWIQTGHTPTSWSPVPT